ncbi:uncharacterized protein [Drosophila kikkawai]|uniref:Uncharacterized protein n=1 Tax=Drosophila kikkawai TaxID=30033 RepID=A0ABM3C4P7_DROKI|nr:uncharacterized protein LOC121502052 [Drosophila kikkawai]
MYDGVLPKWGHALATPAYRRGLCSAHRHAALRICSALRMVSDQAACVLAGTPPLDLLAAERASIHGQTIGRTLNPREKHVLRFAAKEATLAAWQTRWESSSKGEMDVSHDSTAGLLAEEEARFGHEEDDTCTHCQGQLEETAEHMVLNCARLAGERETLEARLNNTISVENLVPLMLMSEANWQAVSDFAARAMTVLRAEERRRNLEASWVGISARAKHCFAAVPREQTIPISRLLILSGCVICVCAIVAGSGTSLAAGISGTQI